MRKDYRTETEKRHDKLIRTAAENRAAVEKAAAAEKAAEKALFRPLESLQEFNDAADAEQIAATGKMLWKATKNALAAGRPWAWLLIDNREQIDAARAELTVYLFEHAADAAGDPFGFQLYRAAAAGIRAVWNAEQRAGRGLTATADETETAAAKIAATDYNAPDAGTVAADIRGAVIRDNIDAAILSALESGESVTAAAAAAGLTRPAVYARIEKIRNRAAAYFADVESDFSRG